MHRHEIDRLWSSLFRRHDEIAFILSIGVVGYDYDFAGSDISQYVINTIELKGFPRLSDHTDTMASRATLGKSP
jgi:hypothetical protein